MQTDRPLGEMSDEELMAHVLWCGTLQYNPESSALYQAALAELSRRARRPAPRETGAQDDA